ncbi:hypothetical protein GE21DRAFT_10666 [Neurospora crassa]|uniref:Uncharacterized protein n=1 Tax=Neurospora crassa (strain ATCC 24698 / 74-OR23-1A / CBS 708.71 / DSM 1257 / FGSC 987) TaxID=367110 RepID=Q7S5P8_NEUCR|nr:hypothetical protein NCU05795 [Neurospora crassa OR74A]EAA30819.1 hypothetical protein NCU05795 [Neurospora crassa OR74A]KHE86620.1 hypothetical protein GE21DRAFT_10666 [Neurospora crassa]|eukprot:XP_960055.1 hypothetical protein NCU05795 [Neurospora crassa OR74A]
MGCGMSTEYREDEKDTLIFHGSQYGSTWQHQPMYQPIYEPESQPIIPIQETDSTYKVTLSTYCSACRLNAQGTKCSDQFGNAWMLERLVSVSPTALQQAVNTQVYGMKELQKYLKYNPNNNLRVQLRGDFCAYFGNPQGHSGPEKYVEAVVQEALEDEEDRSLSPCRPNSSKPRVASKPTPQLPDQTSKRPICRSKSESSPSG